MKLKEIPDHIDPTINLEHARQQSLELVKKRAYISAGAAIVPIPFFDLFVDLGVLSTLLPEINAKFGLSEKHMQVYNPATKKVNWTELRKRGFELSSFVAARTIAKQSVNGIVSKFLTKQVTKFIPLGGSIVAGTLGYVLMKKIAETHVEDCYETAQRLRAQQTP
ncbi:hypothetical protein F4V57_06765 [Acinetobacter qingfengensis]|uniref:DUF697 domain-containing protein n=1 Tax=Acinetobacter qingfengensis TaxID=1262585 RepID=A0A1E7R302_9GAMM|nr:hypothetical protein [Acinetobacter qingfengensis]KAA8733750.1 hypothetical protein F4V57_06765 [Acinetobacter qingfengensis]OEY93739.1 hypothetical protein BJI46_04665 [Acinetobacter qingfengensis]